MVAYAIESRRRGTSVIEEGAFVRERQRILTIPDLSRMQVETAVHESVLDQVRKGLNAAVRVDASWPKNSLRARQRRARWRLRGSAALNTVVQARFCWR